MSDHKAEPTTTTITRGNVSITYNPTESVDQGVPYAYVTISVENEPKLSTEGFVEAAKNLATILNRPVDGWVVLNIERATEADPDEGDDVEANDEDVTTEDDYYALTDVDELIEVVTNNITQAREEQAEEVYQRLEKSAREEIYRRELLEDLKDLDDIDHKTSRESAKLDALRRYFDLKRGRRLNRANRANIEQRREMLETLRGGVED